MTDNIANDVWGVDQIFRHPYTPTHNRFTINNAINANVYEHTVKFDVTVDVPGVKRENITLSYDSFRDTMSVSVATKSDVDINYNYNCMHFMECFGGNGVRTIQFNHDTVDHSNISATLELGVLKIVVPKLGTSPPNTTTDIDIK
jgi:HSP20 family protein